MRLRQCFLVCLLLVLPSTTWADDVSPDQAKALQQQVHDWLAGLFGPSVKLPWQITNQGDHYLLTWPIRGLEQPTGDVATTATLKSLGDGLWSIDQVDVPKAATFSIKLPATGPNIGAGPMQVSYTMGHQDTHGVIDVTLASPSSLHSEVNDLKVTTDANGQHQEQHFDRYLVDIGLRRQPGGRLDLTAGGAVTDWKSASQASNGAPVAIGIQDMHATAKVSGIRPEGVAAVLAAVTGLVGVLPADAWTKHNVKDLSPLARTQLRLLITALGNTLDGISVDETVDGMKLEIAGLGGVKLNHLKVGFGGEAPDGKLHAWLDLGLTGLESPNLPPRIAAYLPHHVEIRPSLSGIMTADLQKLLLDATNGGADGDRLTPDIGAILLHGDATVGLESLSFDLGPAQVEGDGHLTLLATNKWHGEAHLTATGFDDLVTEARTDPQLKQALPVLIMLRGLAQPDGQRLVWDIVSDGPKVTVNGLDLSELGGGHKGRRKRD